MIWKDIKLLISQNFFWTWCISAVFRVGTDHSAVFHQHICWNRDEKQEYGHRDSKNWHKLTYQLKSGSIKSIRDTLFDTKFIKILCYIWIVLEGMRRLCVCVCMCLYACTSTHACPLLWQRDMTDPSYISRRPPGARWHAYTHTHMLTTSTVTDGPVASLITHSSRQKSEREGWKEREGTAGVKRRTRWNKRKRRKSEAGDKTTGEMRKGECTVGLFSGNDTDTRLISNPLTPKDIIPLRSHMENGCH